METKYKTFLILEVALMVLALLFSAGGCERKLGKLADRSIPIESAEQTQSLNEAALAGAEVEELGVIIERNVPVPMRDGTILRADVHRPDRGGPYPVLMQRTPYGKGGNFDRFVKAGYIVVSQDVRGLYASEGKDVGLWRTGKAQAEDGYDTVEWAAKLPGSNGKVGTFGGSALAGMQWRLAPLRPPSLAAMLAESVTARVSDLFPSGISRPYTLTRSLMTRELPEMRRRANRPGVHTRWEALKLWEQDSEKWIKWLPWRELPLEGFEDDEEIKFWRTYPHADVLNLDEGCKDITIPNLDITGWYDFCNGNMLLFRTMVKEAKTEVARKGSQIIIGPWSHGTLGRRRVGDFDFGPDASLDVGRLRIRWFDYWLKGRQNGIDKEPPIKIFIIGDNKWRDEQCWPLQRTKDKILFVTSNCNANTPSGDGKLGQHKPEQAGKDQYLYDPKDPVPTLFKPNLYLLPVDQQPLADRKDILAYQSEPLAERIEVIGNPVVELYAESSAPDTDWFVTLIDVAPDGLARNVSMGVVRARYRERLDKPKLLKPGEVVKYTISMNPTSNAFLPGHRIRLDITSSDFPNYDRNHNTAADQNADATLVTAKQTIYHGGEQATRIILPWVPNPIEKEKPTEEEKGKPEPEKQMYQLHQAAADGDVKEVKSFLSKGADVNAEDEEKKTPLHYAAKTGKMEVVQLLVEAGANVNAMGKNDWPPLCIAAGSNHVAVVDYLIAHGADVNPDNDWTPLQEAPYSSSVEIVELLIAKGANINAGSFTPLHGAAKEERRDIAELLIQKGADVNAKDKKEKTPLHYAAKAGKMEVVQLLIEASADVNAKDNGGMTPFDEALLMNKKDIVELFLAKGADFGSKDKRGLTALHNAAVEGYRDIAELLLAKGVKVDERDDVYEFTALHYAARFGYKNVAEVLITNGADINAKDKWDYQPIHVAAHHDRADVVELLISKGADINAKTSLNQTPLQLAQERRNTKTVKLLRRHGAKD